MGTHEDEQFIEHMLSEIAGGHLSPMEIARALQKMLDMPGYRDGSKSPRVKRGAKRLGKSTTWVYMHLSLFNLRPEVQALLEPAAPEHERLNARTAYAVSRLVPADQAAFVRRAREAGWSHRSLEYRVRNHLLVARAAAGSGPPASLPSRTLRRHEVAHLTVKRLLAKASSALGLPPYDFLAALDGTERRYLKAEVERLIARLEEMKRALEA